MAAMMELYHSVNHWSFCNLRILMIEMAIDIWPCKSNPGQSEFAFSSSIGLYRYHWEKELLMGKDMLCLLETPDIVHDKLNLQIVFIAWSSIDSVHRVDFANSI